MDETGTNQLNDMINGIMSNPDIMNVINGMAKSMSSPDTHPENTGTSEDNAPQLESAADNTANRNIPPLGGINPDMLKMLPNIISMLSPMINQSKTGSPEPDSEDNGSEGEAVSASAAPAGGHSRHHRISEQRTRLLFALKPYLSHSRREAIEQIAKITQITDTLGETGLLSLGRDSHEKKDSELGEIHKT